MKSRESFSQWNSFISSDDIEPSTLPGSIKSPAKISVHESENDRKSIGVGLSRSNKSRSKLSVFDGGCPEIFSLDSVIPPLDKRPSHSEKMDELDSNIINAFESEDYDENEWNSNDKQIELISIQNIPINSCSEMKSPETKGSDWTEEKERSNDIFKRQLRDTDFQLTGIVQGERQEWFRVQMAVRVNEVVYGREKKVLKRVSCVYMGQNWIVVGGGSGNFIVFAKDGFEFEIFDTKGSLTQINCIEITADSKAICVADTDGTLAIYDMKKKKLVHSFQQWHSNCAIITIKIIHNVPEQFHNLQVITADIKGAVKVSYLNEGMLFYSGNSKTLFESTPLPVQHILLLHKSTQDKYRSSSFEDTRYIAFLSVTQLSIYSYSLLSQKAELLYKLQNPEFSVNPYEDMKYLSLCWGEGYVVEAAEFMYKIITLVVSWKQNLYVLKVMPKQEFQFEQSEVLTFQKEIIHANFLAPSILFLIDSQQQVYLFNISDLKGLFNSSSSVTELAKQSGCDSFPLPFNEKFAFQLNYMTGNIAVQTNTNMFSLSRADQEVLFILDGKIGVGALTQWQSVCDALIEKGEWRQAMHFLMNLYLSKDKFVTTLPTDQHERKQLLEESAKIVSTKYLQMCLTIFSKNNNEEMKRRMIGLVVEFLILTENFSYLFGQLRVIVEEHLSGREIFVESLVPFLRRYKVKCIPFGYLQSLVETFEKRNERGLIEKMIVQLDSEQVETSELIELCLKKRFIRAMIYLCMQGGEDVYMTPLSTLWGQYLKAKYSNQSNSNDNITSMDEQLCRNNSSSFSNCQSPNDSRMLGLRSLWYARMCLRQHTITGEAIAWGKYERLVGHLAEWIFQLKNLKEILTLSPSHGFDLVHLFFIEPTAPILNEHPLIINRRQRSSLPNLRLIPNNSDSPMQVQTVLDDILDTLDFCVSQIIQDSQTYTPAMFPLLISTESLDCSTFDGQACLQYLEFYYAIFLSRLSLDPRGKEYYAVNATYMFKALKLILSNPLVLEHLKRYIPNFEIELNINMELQHTQILRLLIENSHFNAEQLQELNQAILNSFQFHEIKAEIYASRGELRKSFEILLGGSGETQLKLFEWVNKMVRSQKIGIEEIEGVIEEKLMQLIEVSSEKTRGLVREHFSHLEVRMIRNMKKYPLQQLDYIRKVLEERDRSEIPKDLLTLYIELLAMSQPDVLVDEMSKYDCDLDACLLICTNNKLDYACAFLYEKQGDILTSFELRLKRLDSLPISSQFREESSSLISLCKKSDDNEYLLFLLLDKLVFHLANLTNQKKIALGETIPDHLIEGGYNASTDDKINIIYECIENVIVDVGRVCGQSTLIKKLRVDYSWLSLGRLKGCLLILFKDSEHMIQTFFNTAELVQQFVNETLSSFHATQLMGYRGNPNCSACLTPFRRESFVKTNSSPIKIQSYNKLSTFNNKDIKWSSSSVQHCSQKENKLIVFKCGHAYHMDCYTDVRKCFQNEISDKKSLLLELTLCFTCISQKELWMTLLFATEEKNKNLKDSLRRAISTDDHLKINISPQKNKQTTTQQHVSTNLFVTNTTTKHTDLFAFDSKRAFKSTYLSHLDV